MILQKIISCSAKISDLNSYINKMTKAFESYVFDSSGTVKLFRENGFKQYPYGSAPIERYYQHLNNLYISMYHLRALQHCSLDTLKDVESFFHYLDRSTHTLDERTERTGLLGVFRDYTAHINDVDKKQTALIDIRNILLDIQGRLSNEAIDFMEKFIVYHDVFKLVSEMFHEPFSAFVYSSVNKKHDPVMELCIFWHVLLNPISQDGAVASILAMPNPLDVKLPEYPDFNLSPYLKSIGQKSLELFSGEQFGLFKNMFLLTTVLDSLGSNKETPLSRFQYRKLVLSLEIMTQIRDDNLFQSDFYQQIQYLEQMISDDDRLFSIIFSQMTLGSSKIDDHDVNMAFRAYLKKAFDELLDSSPALNGDLEKIKSNITKIIKYNYVHNIFFHLLANQPFFKAEFSDKTQEWTIDNAVSYLKFRFLLALMIPDNVLVQYNCDFRTLLDRDGWLLDFKASIDSLWEKRSTLSVSEFRSFLKDFLLSQDEYTIFDWF